MTTRFRAIGWGKKHAFGRVVSGVAAEPATRTKETAMKRVDSDSPRSARVLPMFESLESRELCSVSPTGVWLPAVQQRAAVVMSAGPTHPAPSTAIIAILTG